MELLSIIVVLLLIFSGIIIIGLTVSFFLYKSKNSQTDLSNDIDNEINNSAQHHNYAPEQNNSLQQANIYYLAPPQTDHNFIKRPAPKMPVAKTHRPSNPPPRTPRFTVIKDINPDPLDQRSAFFQNYTDNDRNNNSRPYGS
jgi:hypothetical protein